ncbi:MAG: SDR family oxidoreductase, partial [Proteobacteria bacterium]|nr:SDR family oxidoreductase [Pseudomonadota bacterium]
DVQQWDTLMEIDLKSVYLGCHTSVAAMAESGGGSIINISSVAGIMGNPNTLGYGTAKAGVRYLTKSVALDCAAKGYKVRCNSIHPTYIETPLIDQFTKEPGAIERLGKMVPVGRICQTTDVTPAIVFLASDDSQMMTGSEVVIDGGLSCGYSPRVD